MTSAWGAPWKLQEAKAAPAQPSMQDLMDEALALKLYEEECRAFEKELNPEYFAHAAVFGSGRSDDDKEIYNADSVFVDKERDHDHGDAGSASRLALQQITSSTTRARPAVSKPTAASTTHTNAKNHKSRKYDRDLAIDDLKGAGKGFTALRESQRRALKSEKNGISGGRVEAEQFSTIEGVLDERTTRILQKMINRGELDEVHGCVQTGKEAHVFHAVGLGRVPETDEAWDDAEPRELAVKVFKTTLNEFSNRHEYVTGDRRFDLHFQKKDMRRQIKHWTEKEYRNLCRATKSGIKAPMPYTFKEHVLLMEFIGEGNGWPAPTLKDLTLTPDQQAHFYADILQAVRVLYQAGRLVHGDLSEYNILVREGRTWLIDFGQAVDRSHPDTEMYLRRDLRTLHRFFERAGLSEATEDEVGLLSEELAFEFVVVEGEKRANELLAEYAPLRELLREKQPENMSIVSVEGDDDDEDDSSDESEVEEEEETSLVDESAASVKKEKQLTVSAVDGSSLQPVA